VNLYVTNLPAETTDAQLAALFAPIGAVTAATTWPTGDHDGPTRWAGLVTLAGDGEAAVAALDAVAYRGRVLRVTPAVPLPLDRPR
jgi:RNA recognition motif-containing protein